jgi:Kef-type K+ transport system membrane component KefB
MVLVVAIVGKFFGAFTGVTIRGMTPRESTALGLLTNTRGLTEFITLSVGPRGAAGEAECYLEVVVPETGHTDLPATLTLPQPAGI